MTWQFWCKLCKVYSFVLILWGKILCILFIYQIIFNEKIYFCKYVSKLYNERNVFYVEWQKTEGSRIVEIISENTITPLVLWLHIFVDRNTSF